MIRDRGRGFSTRIAMKPRRTMRPIRIAAEPLNRCPLYVASVRQLIISAGWREKRCPFGDQARAVDSAPLFKAPLFRLDGILDAFGRRSCVQGSSIRSRCCED